MASPKFQIENGVLIKCCDMGEAIIEVPDTVTEIGENAFNSYEDCRRVKEIILPNTVKKINRHAFQAGWKDYGLEKVNIPASVEWLSTCMFENDYYIKSMPFDEGSYLVGKYKQINRAVPLPYISAWPLPMNVEAYRKAFSERPDIKRIFVRYSGSWLKAVSVDEFLSLIEAVCNINKLYVCKYEWSGSLAGNFSGGYHFAPLSPHEIYIDMLPAYFLMPYGMDTLHELSDGWPGSRHSIECICSADKRAVCFDTSSDDMSDYYGDSKYIELLEKPEDSPFYESHLKSNPAAVERLRAQESNTLRTYRP